LAFWAVITTHPQCERRALRHLEWQGFQCYAPKEKIIRVRRGRKVEDIRFLFPRYLFVWIIDQWHALLGTFGVSKILMNGEVPSQLPMSWVDVMKSKERNGVITLPKDRFKIGERVEVTSGLFQGRFGLYQGMTSRQREVVLLGTLGRVELASGNLD
jgi:transcriptional antiterminator RfaH